MNDERYPVYTACMQFGCKPVLNLDPDSFLMALDVRENGLFPILLYYPSYLADNSAPTPLRELLVSKILHYQIIDSANRKDNKAK